MPRKETFAAAFEFLFFIFIVSLFFKLGANTLEHTATRISYVVLILFGLLSLSIKKRFSELSKSPAVFFFFSFLGFEIVRSLWAFYALKVEGLQDSLSLPLHLYLFSPLSWLLYFGFFLVGFLFLKQRKETSRLLWLLSWCGFVLAIAAIPPLLTRGVGQPGYLGPHEEVSFFPSFVYFHSFVKKYLISQYAHPNYVGDIIALGFFSALGLFFYSLQRYLGALKSGKDYERPPISSLALWGMMTGATALAVILLFSRGTMIAFSLVFLISLFVTSAKFFSRAQIGLTLIAFMVVAGFLFWAANLQKTWKEVASSKEEIAKAEVQSSFGTNREGAKRALATYKAFPMWGVGTQGYAAIAKKFATPGSNKLYVMSNLQAHCHYLQVLAEQGVGAYLYFLFLISYFFEVGIGLFKSKSRFQFLAALSLSMPVLMILIHAAIKPVMEYFAIATPVYLFMGLSLAILRSDLARS